jgi:hypothetical protein
MVSSQLNATSSEGVCPAAKCGPKIRTRSTGLKVDSTVHRHSHARHGKVRDANCREGKGEQKSRWLNGRCAGKSRKPWPITCGDGGKDMGCGSSVRVSGAMHGCCCWNECKDMTLGGEVWAQCENGVAVCEGHTEGVLVGGDGDCLCVCAGVCVRTCVCGPRGLGTVQRTRDPLGT